MATDDFLSVPCMGVPVGEGVRYERLEPDEDPNPGRRGERPITDGLVCLKQAANILKLVEELGACGDFEEDTGEIVDVIKTARRLIEEVIEAFTAYFAAQGDAT